MERLYRDLFFRSYIGLRPEGAEDSQERLNSAIEFVTLAAGLAFLSVWILLISALGLRDFFFDGGWRQLISGAVIMLGNFSFAKSYFLRKGMLKSIKADNEGRLLKYNGLILTLYVSGPLGFMLLVLWHF